MRWLETPDNCEPGDTAADGEVSTRPADDPRECRGCPCSPDRVVFPFGEPHGFAGCRDCHHQVEPDPAEMARRYGPESTVPDWRKRLACSRCGSHDTDIVVTGTERRAKVGITDAGKHA
jgi:hypothetical protein